MSMGERAFENSLAEAKPRRQFPNGMSVLSANRTISLIFEHSRGHERYTPQISQQPVSQKVSTTFYNLFQAGDF